MIADVIRLIRYSSRDRAQRVWLLSTLFIVALLLIGLLVGFYMNIYVQAMKKNVEAGRAYVISKNIEKKLFENFSEYSSRVDRIFDGMSSKWSQPEVVRNIEKIAQANKILVKGQNYRQVETKSGVDSFLIDISASGRYADIKSFVSGMSQLRGKSVINSLKLVSVEGEEGLVLSIKVIVFHIKAL